MIKKSIFCTFLGQLLRKFTDWHLTLTAKSWIKLRPRSVIVAGGGTVVCQFERNLVKIVLWCISSNTKNNEIRQSPTGVHSSAYVACVRQYTVHTNTLKLRSLNMGTLFQESESEVSEQEIYMAMPIKTHLDNKLYLLAPSVFRLNSISLSDLLDFKTIFSPI